MSDNLTVFGTDYTGVTGIKATGTGNGTLTYIRPSGTKSIGANGTGIDVTEYASVDVSVSGGTPRTSTDLTVSGATVTAPAGVYASDASKSVESMTLPTAASATSSGTSKATITPGSSAQYINIPTGYNSSAAYYTISAGGGMNVQAYTGYASRTANSYGATSATLTVKTTGTYTVSWAAWRSSSQGVMGTNLYVNDTAGTNQQTFTSTYGQCITLTDQHYSEGDVLTVYATSGSNSRTINVANLVIVQTA